MQIVFRHFWIVFVLVTLANGATWWHRGRRHRERDPSLASGYRSLVGGFVTWGNLPWVVMGAGILFGGVPSIFHYFDPKSSNPFVIAFFGSIFLLWVLGTHWLFARGGAELIVRHPGLTEPETISPGRIKLLWIVGVAGGIAGVAVMYARDFQPPL